MPAFDRVFRFLPIGSLVSAVLACNPSTVPPSTPPPTSTPPAPSTREGTPAPEPKPGPSISRAGSFPAAVHGMAIDPSGRLYLSDSFGTLDSAARVHRQDPPHTAGPEPTALDVTQPAGLEFIDGVLHLCDLGGHRVVRYDEALAPVTTWTIETPWNVGRSATGALLVVTYDGRLVRLDPDGTTELLLEGLASPFDLAPTAEGPVWISEQGAKPGDPGRVALWTLEGEMLREAEHAWATPEGLALDPQGNLWVAETEGRQLLRVSPGGEVEIMEDVDGLPIVIAPLPSGDLLVSVTGPAPHLLRIEFSREEPVAER